MAEQDDIFGAIEALNLTYLDLVQQMLQIDREVAARELGISSQMAAWIIALTPEQIEELASRSAPLCELREEVVPARA
ncbi:flagellar transcriptional regulator FlhD [Burkholderia multivorans]|uniref:flagellar transcriptional regulator FlhD n=1 Tax=Burkholderia multivorans TaxID=87883 RepID=UPI000D00C687|nr:flagellar transcriptional regulator FlhD [Burkholderia multivorans]MBU9296687.1 flagellar transcriptional regulator FlhD [Burkholderia multivorans]PRH32667.1 flagellar transcriptional regulator FlhD [Burkholderia multivorans]